MGVPTPEECVNLFFGKTFAENCMQMKEIGLNFGEGASLVALLEWEKDP